MDREFTQEVIIALIEVLNKYKPKIGCGYFDQADEKQADQLMNQVNNQIQIVMDEIYPDRKR